MTTAAGGGGSTESESGDGSTGGEATAGTHPDDGNSPSRGLFLGDSDGVRRLREVAGLVVDVVEQFVNDVGPRSDIDVAALDDLVRSLDPCPDDPVAIEQVLAEIGERVLAHGVRPWDPLAIAHLHSPTLLTSAAAEMAIGVTNQSMDSYDQAPAATLVEDHLVGWLAGVLGMLDGASGVLTAGGTTSNLLGLLLARDHAAGPGPGTGFGPGSVGDAGLPEDAHRWRIVTSAEAHFSVDQSAAVLGLGRQAVVTVATDDRGRMAVDALDATLSQLDADGLRPIALVGTAGTTDQGAIDPLAALADRAEAHDAWFHVDAAVGAGLCLSDRLRSLVDGLGRADSVTADLHKLWWQPIGASALLVRNPQAFDVMRQPSDYLDRTDDDELGVLNLVRRSLDTSRRFDALKVLVSLRSTGRRALAALVEHLVDTTHAAADVIAAHDDLELLTDPSTITVLFRWHPSAAGGQRARIADVALDAGNTAVQRSLFDTGRAVVGRTRHQGRVALKLTLVNPRATVDDVAHLADLVAAEGAAWARRRTTPLETVP